MEVRLELEYRPDTAALARLGIDLEAAFRRAAGRTRDRARLNIRDLRRVDTGAMMQRIESVQEGKLRYRISATTSYAGFQEFGTRAHGPRNARVLSWTPRGASRPVFARRVRGVVAGRFMRMALDDLSESDFR